jgi:predicted TIM-barrel fold metal-dependent hydrolase
MRMAIVMLAALAASPGFADSNISELPPAVVDHHLHIQGPELTELLRKLAARTPDLFKGIDPSLLNARSGDDALRVLDEAGIKQGVLLSVAYAFASPFSKQDVGDIGKLTRLENEYNVAQAASSKGRLKAFVGVNPLAEGALDELKYWAHRDGVTGVKVQLSNSGYDPSSDRDVATLARFFGAAKQADLPIVIHARSATSHTPADVRRFIDEVLARAPNLPIQVAHANGGGGLDEAVLAGLACYQEAIARGAPGTEKLVFDLSVVVVDEKTDPVLAGRLADAMRGIGLNRFVMASDWPSVLTPRKHNELLESQVPLTTAEWKVVLANRAPYL